MKQHTPHIIPETPHLHKRLLILCIVLFSFLGLWSSSFGQWTKISSEKLDPAHMHIGGILTYQKGMLLYGYGNTLRVSKDDGLSWTVLFQDTSKIINPRMGSIPADTVGASIYDINFFDHLNGCLSNEFDVFFTNNGGSSWIHTYSHFAAHSILFLNTPGYLFTSPSEPGWYTDNAEQGAQGGVNWRARTIPTTGQNYYKGVSIQKRGNDPRIYAIAFIDGQVANPFFTIDTGKTWTSLPGIVDEDCNSFGIDSCNENLVAVINEETFLTTDGIAGIYVSTDGGNSFSFHNPADGQYYCGSLSVAPGGIIFIQTMRDGILRSTDNGQTWKSIGGPNGLLDSRLISAVTPDLIYAADDTGAVWMTTNSGGFPTGIPYTRFETPEKMSTDTIGGDLYIPITILSQSSPQDVAMNLTFINKNLKYKGTASVSGVSLDVAGATTTQSSQIVIPASNVKIGQIVAYSHFILFADTSISSVVNFDLLPGISQQPQCAHTLSSTSISGPTGCGIRMMSHLLQTGKVLGIASIYPNPAVDEITINVESAIKQDVNLEVFDALGVRVFSDRRNISSGANTIHFDTKGLSAGVYLVKVGGVSQSLVISR